VPASEIRSATEKPGLTVALLFAILDDLGGGELAWTSNGHKVVLSTTTSS
jgi:hypothetical protein